MSVLSVPSALARPCRRFGALLAGATARRAGAAAVVFTVLGAVLLVPPLAAAPSQGRAHVGYADVETNGFGGSDSWGGSLRLFTGADQSGETIIGYCIDRGLNYPRGTDPDWVDANSGFALAGDLPAARGVSSADRGALAYLLWRYGDTGDVVTAGAMFLLTHLLSGDPDFGSTTLEATVLGGDWPNPSAVRSRASALRDEARAHRGPWALDVVAERRDDDRVAVTVDLAGVAGPIAGVPVDVHVAGGDGSGPRTTDADGRISFLTAPDTPGGAVTVTATRATTPGPYRVFHGRAGTQRVITAGADGPAVRAEASVGPARGRLQIAKTTTNPTYQSGAGATFAVHRGGPDGPVIAEVTIGADGVSPVVEDLSPGPYTLVETGAPTGQVVRTEPVEVTVAAGALATANVENTVARDGILRLTKRDATTGERVAGARFVVAADRDGDGTFESPVGPGPDGDEGTDDDGMVQSTGPGEAPAELTGLVAGRYEIVEVAPPPGFTLPPPDDRRRVVDLTYGAPGDGDDVVEVDLSVDNVRPLLTTQVVAAPGPAATEPAPAGDIQTENQTENQAESEPEPESESEPDVGSEHVTDPDAVGDGSPADPLDWLPAARVAVGHTVRDRITVDNVAADVGGSVTLSWFGPFATPDAIECGDPMGSATIEVTGSGVVDGPPVTLDEPGWYTFRAELALDDGGQADHTCGIPSETVAAVGIETTAAPGDAAWGSPVSDTVRLTGVGPDLTGDLTVTLFGPYAHLDDAVCDDAHAIDTQTAEVNGAGPFTSEGVVPEVAGVYTYVATWQTEDLVVTHPCGLAAESVTASPGITTQVAQPAVELADGGRAELRDLALVEGVADGVAGTVRFSLFGPFPARSADQDPADVDLVCGVDSHVTTVEAPASGSGQVTSPAITVDAPGRYTWMASWHADDATLAVGHECGLAEETAVVGVPVGPPPAPSPPVGAIRALAATGGSGRLALGGASLLAAGACLVAGMRRWPHATIRTGRSTGADH